MRTVILLACFSPARKLRWPCGRKLFTCRAGETAPDAEYQARPLQLIGFAIGFTCATTAICGSGGFCAGLSSFLGCPLRRKGVKSLQFCGGASHEPTFSTIAFDSCCSGVPDLQAARGCCGLANPDQGADQTVPCHREGGEQPAVRERHHRHLASYAFRRHGYPRCLFPSY